MFVRDYKFHCLVMTFLFLCQGFGQGVLVTFPLLVLQLNPSLSPSAQATLKLPILCFAFKFLWAPFVDHCYSARLAQTPIRALLRFPRVNEPDSKNGAEGSGEAHRRFQWVVPLQLCLAVIFLILARYGEWLAARSSTSSACFWQLFLLLMSIAFLNSTQDVGVDGWAMEGLPAQERPHTGSMQLIGITSGIAGVLFFVQLNDLFPAAVTIGYFGCFVSVLCVVGAVGATALAHFSPLVMSINGEREEGDGKDAEAQPEPTVSSIWRTFLSFLRADAVRDVTKIALCIGIPTTLRTLIISRLMATRLASAAELVRFRLVGSAVQMVLAAVLTSQAVKQHGAPHVLRVTSRAAFAVHAGATVLFLIVPLPVKPNHAIELYLLAFVVLNAMTTAFTSVCNSAIANMTAMRFPKSAGTVITLLNAINNFGVLAPESANLFLLDFFSHLVSRFTNVSSTRFSNKARTTKWTFTEAKMDILFCAAVTFPLSAFVRRKYVATSIARLRMLDQEKELPPV